MSHHITSDLIFVYKYIKFYQRIVYFLKLTKFITRKFVHDLRFIRPLVESKSKIDCVNQSLIFRIRRSWNQFNVIYVEN